MAASSGRRKAAPVQRRGTRRFLFLALFLILAALVLWALLGQHEIASSARLSDGVLIDPGHGGDDVGAIAPGSGVHEDTLNLAVSLALADELSARGTDAPLTRSDDNALGETKELDMQKRARIIGERSGGVMVSIHMNSFPSDSAVWGPQVFYQEGSASGRALADAIQARLNAMTGGTRKSSADNLYVLRAANVPAVLVECGFLTNPAEDSKLQQADYQQELAKAIADGIADYCK